MLLYHYSDHKQTHVLTARKAGTLKKEVIDTSVNEAIETHAPGAKCDSIVLFLEPVPVDIISSIFNDKHPFWKKGATLYEHVIDTDDLPVNLLWSLMDTPEVNEYKNKMSWEVTSNRIPNLIQVNEYKVKKGLTQRGIQHLAKKAKQYIGKGEEYFMRARTMDDADLTLNLLGGHVPQVALFPYTGRVPVKSVEQVVLTGSTTKVSALAMFKRLLGKS